MLARVSSGHARRVVSPAHCSPVNRIASAQHMSDEDESKVAIENLNGSEYQGVKITVEASHSKVRPKPGMGGKGQCYRCGKSGHWSKECPRNSYDRAPYDR